MSALLETLIQDPERREALRADDMRAMTGSGYRWPEVDKHTHPALHQRPSVERRTGPRASRFNDLEDS